jgi:hypothetical protein
MRIELRLKKIYERKHIKIKIKKILKFNLERLF